MRNTHCLHCGKCFAGIRFNLSKRKFCNMLCTKDYERSKRAERFWTKIDKGPHPKGCWVWTGYCQKFGHGWLGRGDGSGGSKGILAHRYAWQLLVGPVPAGKFVLHDCDNPPCVNPEHLYIGVRQDNASDMATRGRSSWGERNSHAKLTEENVREIRRAFVRTHKNKSNIPALARRYGVTSLAIRAVVLRLSWRHLP